MLLASTAAVAYTAGLGESRAQVVPGLSAQAVAGLLTKVERIVNKLVLERESVEECKKVCGVDYPDDAGLKSKGTCEAGCTAAASIFAASPCDNKPAQAVKGAKTEDGSWPTDGALDSEAKAESTWKFLSEKCVPACALATIEAYDIPAREYKDTYISEEKNCTKLRDENGKKVKDENGKTKKVCTYQPSEKPYDAAVKKDFLSTGPKAFEACTKPCMGQLKEDIEERLPKEALKAMKEAACKKDPANCDGQGAEPSPTPSSGLAEAQGGADGGSTGKDADESVCKERCEKEYPEKPRRKQTCLVGCQAAASAFAASPCAKKPVEAVNGPKKKDGTWPTDGALDSVKKRDTTLNYLMEACGDTCLEAVQGAFEIKTEEAFEAAMKDEEKKKDIEENMNAVMFACLQPCSDLLNEKLEERLPLEALQAMQDEACKNDPDTCDGGDAHDDEDDDENDKDTTFDDEAPPPRTRDCGPRPRGLATPASNPPEGSEWEPNPQRPTRPPPTAHAL